MSTLVTPSAKSHERVTGRWLQDIQAQTRREWFVYYLKMVIGTPIPWLIWAYVTLDFLSRAGVEIAAWSAAFLTATYIGADRFSRTREFRFFSLGYDVFLLGMCVVGIACAVTSNSFVDAVASLGCVRWILLFYLVTYCWELFPGLNRAFYLLIFSAAVAAAYGIWQHFSGVDAIRGTELLAAPVPGHAYFTISSFFNTPELCGTLLAMVLPFPVASFLLFDRRDEVTPRRLSLALFLFLALAIAWTYQPGLWIAAGVSVFSVILLHWKHSLNLLATTAAFFAVIFVSFYLLSGATFDGVWQGIEKNESIRAEHQRGQMNAELQLWLHNDDSPRNVWIGTGNKAEEIPGYDPGSGNAYFQLLAQEGALGTGFFFIFVLGFLLRTYRTFHEIPESHTRHRICTAGCLGGLIAFLIAGLYWSTLSEALTVNLFVMFAAAVSYLTEHYGRGLVTDDSCL